MFSIGLNDAEVSDSEPLGHFICSLKLFKIQFEIGFFFLLWHVTLPQEKNTVKTNSGTSLMVQWLRPPSSTGGVGLN